MTNPAPGGGTSGNSPFTVNNPIPTITSLSPTSGTKGGAAFTLTVNGTGFVSTSVVNFNGAAKTTTFVSATQITASIAAADIAAAGTLNVTVTNLAPGGGTSGISTFTVNNPVPAITSLSPTSAITGGAAFTLTVNGTSFVSGAVVSFNGNARTTTFVSATQVTAAITAGDIATAGTFNVSVTNPAPGGGASGNSPFNVNNPVPAITTLSPSSATVGGVAFTLTVNGTNFVSGAVVNFNGNAKTTTFVSATQVTAADHDDGYRHRRHLQRIRDKPIAGRRRVRQFVIRRQQSGADDYFAQPERRHSGRSRLHTDGERNRLCFHLRREIQRQRQDHNLRELDATHRGDSVERHHDRRIRQCDRNESGSGRRHNHEFCVHHCEPAESRLRLSLPSAQLVELPARP